MSWVHHLEEQERLIPPPSPLTRNQDSPIQEDDPSEREVHSAPLPLPQPQVPMTETITTEQMLLLMQQMQQQILNLQQQNQTLL